MRWLSSLLAIAISLFIFCNPVHAQGQNVRVALDNSHTAMLHIPANYSPGGKYPLMMSFHGHGGSGAGQQRKTGFDAVADEYGFFVVYPDAPTRSWQLTGSDNDIDFAVRLLQKIESTYPIDPGRVYASGFSQGGGMTQALACLYTDRFAGAAVVSEDLHQGFVKRCHPSRPITMIFMHGTDDPISPYNAQGKKLSASETAGFWARNNGCSSPATSNLARSPGDPTTESKTLYQGCRGGTHVTLYTINGGGHTWPGGVGSADPERAGYLGATSTLPASRVIWQELSGQAH